MKIRMWSDRKTNDYKFVDKVLNNYFQTTGTKMLIHKFVGHYDEEGNVSKRKIQDLLFMESRDRHYSNEIYEMYGIYQMSDSDFELSQFGFFNIDTMFLDFHLNTHVEQLGRKLASGDVIELVHLRDDMLESGEGAMNAYFVVEDAKRSAEGYDARWLPHIWRVRVKKMSASREYNDILENSETSGLEQLMGQYNRLKEINEGVVAEAEEEVPYADSYNDWEYKPHLDGAIDFDKDLDIESIDRGSIFPVDAVDGDYFIRNDYDPMQLFKKVENKWVIVNMEELHRKWTRGHAVQDHFVNNDRKTEVDGEVRAERTYITKPIDIPIDDS